MIDGAGNSGHPIDHLRSTVLEAPINTAAPDLLTRISSSSDIYLLLQLSSSLLGPSTSPTYDTITSFEAIDKLQVSGRACNARLTTSSDTAAGHDPTQLATVLPDSWAAYTASSLGVSVPSGTFVALIDNISGFQSD